MIFATLPLADCVGAILAHSLLVGGARIAKGTLLTAAHIDAASTAGLEALAVARLEPGDIGEDEAAIRLGTALAGPGMVAEPPVHGRVNLAAAAPGLLRLDPAAVDALNAVDERLTLGTLPPHARVAAGDLVATIKVIPYAVPGAMLDAALARAVAAQLSLAAFSALRVTLIQTRLPGQPDKMFARTVDVTRARLAGIGATLAVTNECPHDADSLAAALSATDLDALVLVAGASATVDRRDVVPAAIEAAGGEVLRVGMPVDPGNLLCLGRLNGRPVLGLPGCARSPKRNGVDLVLERLAAGLPVDSVTIAAMGVGGLLPDLAARPEPRIRPVAPATKVGAVILAAGRSSRMGGINKLVADLQGKPVLAHVLDAVAAAGLPALVVLGDRAEAVRAAARDRPAMFVTAPDYAEGLSRSLAAGLAAVPADWGAALVCLGDMPVVDAAILRRLSAAASAGAIIVPVSGGKRGNPVLWGRAHFPRLAALTGDVGGKQLLGELADQVTLLEVGGDAIFADADTPDALDALRRR